MMKPKSLTATIHVRFHYNDGGEEVNQPSSGEVNMLGKILDQAYEMDPELREMLVKFADYLKEFSRKNGQD